ncbi:MAG TPA: hypothetical protein PK916_04665 [Bacteroidota bacterium]|nr:hypothetical protein [Bacteroidota bacterium]
MLNRFTLRFALAVAVFTVSMTLVLPAFLIAQDVIPFPTDAQSLIDYLPWALSLVTPLLLGLLKKLLLVKTQQVDEDGNVIEIYELPVWFPKWLPMLLNPLLNWLALWLTSLATGGEVSAAMVAVLMLASSFIYNVYEQIFKVATGTNNRVVKITGLPQEIQGI